MDNHVDNLRPISIENNNMRAAAKRRFKSKTLGDQAVKDIRAMKNKTHQQIAHIYGVSRRTVQRVKNMETYADV